MKKILMLNLPYTGHVNPTLGVARELVNRGYEVSYINSEKYRDKIEATGVHYIPYINYPDNLSIYEEGVNSIKAAYDTALAVGKNYDLLIFEDWFFPGVALAEELNIPVVKLFTTIALNNQVFHKEIIKKTPYSYHLKYKFIRRIVTKTTAKGIKTKYNDFFQEISNAVPEVNIVYTIRELQAFPKLFDRRFFFVGPSIPIAPMADMDLYEQFKNPIIYISMGTVLKKQMKFLKICIDAFKDKDYTVIVSTGNDPNIVIEEFGDLPSNIQIFPFVQQTKILENAALFITHGGMNSVNESIANGVPMIVFPQIFDNFTNADKVQQLNLGLRMNHAKITSKQIYQAAEYIINNKEIKDNLKKYKGIMKQTNAAVESANIVEKYISECYADNISVLAK